MPVTKTHSNSRTGKKTVGRKGLDNSQRNQLRRKSQSVRQDKQSGTIDLPIRFSSFPDVKQKFREVKGADNNWLIRFLQDTEIGLAVKSNKKHLYHILSNFLKISEVMIEEKDTLLDFIYKCSKVKGIKYLQASKDIVKIEPLFSCDEGVISLDLQWIKDLRKLDLKNGMLFRQIYLMVLDKYSGFFASYMAEIEYYKEAEAENFEELLGYEREERTRILQQFLEWSSIISFAKISEDSSQWMQDKRFKIIEKVWQTGYFKNIGMHETIEMLLYVNIDMNLFELTEEDIENKKITPKGTHWNGPPMEFDDLFMIIDTMSDDYDHPYVKSMDERWGNNGSYSYFRAIGSTVNCTGNDGALKLHNAISTLYLKLKKLIDDTRKNDNSLQVSGS